MRQSRDITKSLAKRLFRSSYSLLVNLDPTDTIDEAGTNHPDSKRGDLTRVDVVSIVIPLCGAVEKKAERLLSTRAGLHLHLSTHQINLNCTNAGRQYPASLSVIPSCVQVVTIKAMAIGFL